MRTCLLGGEHFFILLLRNGYSAMHKSKSCACHELAEQEVVPMGFDGLDDRIFATLDKKAAFGEEKWWLSVSRCRVCDQSWLIGSEERIHDNYCLKRINAETYRSIIEQSKWPEDFQLYEQILRLSVEGGAVAMFLDPYGPVLILTAKELIAARPEITVGEIAFALNLDKKQRKKLLKNLEEISSSKQEKQWWSFITAWLVPRT
jgi:hypothetical protein